MFLGHQHGCTEERGHGAGTEGDATDEVFDHLGDPVGISSSRFNSAGHFGYVFTSRRRPGIHKLAVCSLRMFIKEMGCSVVPFHCKF